MGRISQSRLNLAYRSLTMTPRTVTKHAFLTSLGCTTRAWYAMRESGGVPTPADQLRMDEGQDVHRRAQSIHPDGVFAGSLAKTKQCILDRTMSSSRRHSK